MEENLFLSFYHEKSKRHAVIEDDGLTAWFYLHLPSDDPHSTGGVDADAFIYNREDLIDVSDVKGYKPNPPPIAKGYGHDISVCRTPTSYDWSVSWSIDGESVVLFRDAEPWCFIVKDERKGYSKAIKTDGPWGHPWNETIFKILG